MNLAFELKIAQLSSKEKQLHEKALTKATAFKKSHAELLEVIIEVDRTRLFEKFVLTSTFSYCTQILNLSEDVTCTLTKLARVSQKIPELKSAIDEGLSISKARQIAAIVTKENKTEWIEKAKTLSQKTLQKTVAISFPKEAVQEKVKYVAKDRLKVELGLDEETIALLRWAQDFVSQKSKMAANMEETLKKVLTEFKDKNDPVKRAERIRNRAVTKVLPAARRGAEQNRRTSIPAHIIHQVNLRDQRKCQAQLPNGQKCENTRWLDYHHKIEVQHGGAHSLENITTLCARHHRAQHLRLN